MGFAPLSPSYASRAAAKLALPPTVMRFQRLYPDVNVEVVVDNAMIDIVAAGFDAGVRLGETIEADMPPPSPGGAEGLPEFRQVARESHRRTISRSRASGPDPPITSAISAAI